MKKACPITLAALIMIMAAIGLSEAQRQFPLVQTQFTATLKAPSVVFVGETFTATVHIVSPTQMHPTQNGASRFYDIYEVGGEPAAPSGSLRKHYDYIDVNNHRQDRQKPTILDPSLYHFIGAPQRAVRQRNAQFKCIEAGQATMTYQGVVTYKYQDVPAGRFPLRGATLSNGSQTLFSAHEITCKKPIQIGLRDDTYTPDGTVQLEIRLPKPRLLVGELISFTGKVSHTKRGQTRKLKTFASPDGVVARVKNGGFSAGFYPKSPQDFWELRTNEMATFHTGNDFYCAEEGSGLIEVEVQSHSGTFDDDTLRRLEVHVECMQVLPREIDEQNPGQDEDRRKEFIDQPGQVRLPHSH